MTYSFGTIREIRWFLRYVDEICLNFWENMRTLIGKKTKFLGLCKIFEKFG